MDKVDADGINAFRSALELAGDGLAQPRTAEDTLRSIIDDLEERLQKQDELLVKKDMLIEDLQRSKTHTDYFTSPTPQPAPNSELEKVKVQLNDALAERDELKEKYRDALRKVHTPDSAEKKEIARLKSDLKGLKEAQAARIRAEREAERDKVQAELSAQKGGWRRIYACIEKLAIRSVAVLSEHEAESQEIRDLARDLRAKPDELRSRLAMDEITYQDAFEELAPLIYWASGEIAKTKKRSLPISKVEYRARLLLDSLDDNESISASRATDIIYGDEKVHPQRRVVLRAMEKAAVIAPHKAVYQVGTRDGMPSMLKRIGGSS